ncbi:hypothetical protein ASPSYDRAFT_1164257 [Aspergillus sydowii CBS 593.65]|uniref:Uncharacterized protein n=1 Tax=Aspergillus sydowii CBS 593.65 TaxID=1036612 RepID=A0A1L9T2C1_9EURO|nr:uncharacterized protein ASPSYDRAFT_1164257 [Aspergillus sydowii CBS 593.65]OJJ53568.1 hypothetical protein ASPSYDRAFT_1164257 [Aspergillus sydowii CBS 593.65]
MADQTMTARSDVLRNRGLSEGQRVGIGFAILIGSFLLITATCALSICISRAIRRRRRRDALRRECEPDYPDFLPIHVTPVETMPGPLETMPEEPPRAAIQDDSYRFYCKAREAAVASVAPDDGIRNYDPVPAYTRHADQIHNRDNQTDDVSRTGARGYGDERVENHEERVVYVQVLTPRLAATPTTPQSIEL